MKSIWAGIFTTFLTRILAATINLLLLLLSARMLGAEGRGTINLFVVHLAIVNIASELMAGPSVVYFISRMRGDHLRTVAFAWSFFIISILSLTFRLLHTLPVEWTFMLWSIAVLGSFTGIQMQVRAGKEQLFGYNFIHLSVPFLQCVLFGILVYFLGEDVHHYFTAWVMSLGLVSLSILPEWTRDFSTAPAMKELLEAGKSMFQKGRWIFLANLFHLLAVRITFWMIDYWNGTQELGRYGTAVSLTESLLIFSGSLSLALYARIAHAGKEEAPELGKLNALVLWITFLGCAFLLIIPENTWVMLLGKSFGGTQTLMGFYAPSVLLMSASTVMSNYFSGMAMYRIPATGSLSALMVSVVMGYFLVPEHMGKGAAIAVGAGNLVQFIWLIFAYLKHEKELTLHSFFKPVYQPLQIFK